MKRIDDLPERPHPDVFICPFHDRPTDFTYYIGVEVTSDNIVPEGMVTLTIPAKQYSVFTHRGPMKKLNLHTPSHDNGYQSRI